MYAWMGTNFPDGKFFGNSGETMIELIGLATLLFASAAVVLWKQSKAKQCRLHNRFAGYFAMVIATGAMIVGMLILLFASSLR